MLGAVLTWIVFAAVGVALVTRLAPRLSALERWTLGPALGHTLAALLAVGISAWTGFGPRTLVLLLVASAAALAWTRWPGGRAAPQPPAPPPAADEKPQPMGLLGILGFLALIAFWAVFWSRALVVDGQGLWAGSRYIWADWAMHLGDVSSMVYDGNVPPHHPRFVGESYRYHFLIGVDAALMSLAGLDPVRALPLQSALLCLLMVIGLIAVGRRLIGSPGAAVLATALFLFGGHLGWWFTLRDVVTVPGALQNPAAWWNTGALDAAGLQWPVVAFHLAVPQRPVLLGVPLVLLVLVLLHDGLERSSNRSMAFAGVVMGLLPLAHFGGWLSLAFALPWLVALQRGRGWRAFAAGLVLAMVPAMILLRGGGEQLGSSWRWDPGWLADDRSWPLFWLGNLGPVIPLLVVAVVWPPRMEAGARLLLYALLPLFVICNLLSLFPWPWDNTKVLMYWYLAVCMLVAALVVEMWRGTGALGRVIVSLGVAMMLGSGIVMGAQALAGGDRHRMLSAEDLVFAAAFREHAPRGSVVAAAPLHDHPASMLGGRTVVTGYGGWLWSTGLPFQEREADMVTLYELAPGWERVLERYHIDLIVVGPKERQRYALDTAALHANFDTLFTVPGYEVLAVTRPVAVPGLAPGRPPVTPAEASAPGR